MMFGCRKCTMLSALTFLVLGLLFLLVDLGIWDFWGIKAWTAFFILLGVIALGHGKCADCQACCMPEVKKSGKKR